MIIGHRFVAAAIYILSCMYIANDQYMYIAAATKPICGSGNIHILPQQYTYIAAAI